MNVKKCGLAFLVLVVMTVWTSDVRADKPAIDKGLVVFLAFDGAGGKAIKTTGPHKVIVTANGCKVDAAGNGAILDGQTFVRIGLPGGLEISEKTLAAWVNMSQSAKCSGAGIVTVQKRSAAGEPFDSIVWNERGKGWIFGSERHARSADSNVLEKSKPWVHIAAVYRKDDYVMYRNGKEIARLKGKGLVAFKDAEILIGRRHERPTDTFIGNIDEVYVFDRALAADEVASLYAAEKEHFDKLNAKLPNVTPPKPAQHRKRPPRVKPPAKPVKADPLPPLKDEPGFKSIFDGKTLKGWKAADMSYWSVEDGAITGTITKEHPSRRNHYLVCQEGKLGDFELKMRHRMVSPHRFNCGFQFRSEIFDGRIKNDCRGYQMDNNTGTPWLVRLYDEFGRHTLAMRGKRTVFDKAGKRTTTNIEGAGGPARFRLEDWHEYHLICRGPKITLKVNGRLVAEVIDNDPKQQDFSGIFAPQLHSGPPQKVQFKDIRIKLLDAGDGKK